jgi:phosphate/sulfate permease
MTKTVTVPIKCSTVKKVKDSIPFIFFWIVVVASIIGSGWIVYKATLPGVMLSLSDADIFALIGIGMCLATISFLLLYVSCPYEFKCIQE